MERLTRNYPEHAAVLCDNCDKEYESCDASDCLRVVAKRLADIEDILGDTYDLDRLRELVEAEKAGKNFVSPCKIGDTVYILHYGKCPHLNSATVSGIHLRDETYRGGKKRREYVVVRKNGFSKHLPIDRIGKMWFLHADSAESALAKEADQ